MSEKKQLNEEELKEVAGGELASRYCWNCGRYTTPKMTQEDGSMMSSFTCVCSICGKSYE